jgi:hypothetical protein
VAKFVAIHVQQLGEKKTSPYSHVLIGFFGATNPYTKNDEQ